MSMLTALKISSSAMNAQMMRLNTTASNLANIDVVGSTSEEAYKAKKPIFKTVIENYTQDNFGASVSVNGIFVSDRENTSRYDPQNPLASRDGYVFMSNVNSIEEMVDMTNASRSYQTNVEVMNATKKMMMSTLQLGK
ncbi:flagellar basal body rod protein FlgC [Candidatus Njordibacter sp. Uisw_056]|jgi:flagellar basal-body rod protein FlgC|uniref:flagellar basal body rod protein FlgC n=1 Tax=Candidatus Njordibacter sp. Uisw_056 TaxID=3230973 RepID=UPI003D5A7E68|tara:strand:+ start:84 stop:497 length:414 start_codon:yes stop_codon:yes gene_type:complete